MYVHVCGHICVGRGECVCAHVHVEAKGDWEYLSSTLFTEAETLNQARNLLID